MYNFSHELQLCTRILNRSINTTAAIDALKVIGKDQTRPLLFDFWNQVRYTATQNCIKFLTAVLKWQFPYPKTTKNTQQVEKKLCHCIFAHNTDKLWPIFKILQQLLSPRNLLQNPCHIFHHTFRCVTSLSCKT